MQGQFSIPPILIQFNFFFVGRFEILTGGWVMTDEANVELFSMVDQLVEGHQWLLHTFNFKPKSSWSVDPFGHGAAFPYVLKASGVDGEFLKGKIIIRGKIDLVYWLFLARI